MAAPGVLSVPSKLENYRAKAKEFARLAVAAKSLRDGRRYRKLARVVTRIRALAPPLLWNSPYKG
jgi:hypothetical protein